MDFKILHKELVYKGFNSLTRYEFEIESYDHTWLRKLTEVFERGDSCSILLYEKDTKSILFTEQFRMPVCKHMNGWIQELVAGRIEGSDTPEDTIIRETAEEIGYNISKLEQISMFYLSPGVSTERIFLFYSEVETKDKKAIGGGLKEENEDIKLIKIPVSELKSLLKGNSIMDAKSIIGIQWFLMNLLT